MKKISLILTLLSSLNLIGQLKVDTYGKIIIGSPLTNLPESAQIYGDLKMISTNNSGANYTYFKVNNGVPGLDIGGTNKGVSFYFSGKYQPVYCSNLFKVSDSVLKFNHFEIQNPMAKLQSLQPYFYNMYSINENQVVTMNSEYGFFSQEVASALPDVDITKDVHDYKVLDYDQIIPIIVAAMKEQQQQIDSLQSIIMNCCQVGTERSQMSHSLTKTERSIITNLSPNPNDGKFKVDFQLATEVKNAAFEITDASGKQISYIKLSSNDLNNRTLEINIGLFNSGIYNISLVADGVRSDMKKLLKQ
ncbi:MAG: hypothetical protein RLZZ382_1419 [Bacteroidota bacterium]|jgi:Secretion system C-terminal sorting domain